MYRKSTYQIERTLPHSKYSALWWIYIDDCHRLTVSPDNLVKGLTKSLEKQLADRGPKKPVGGVSTLPESKDVVRELKVRIPAPHVNAAMPAVGDGRLSFLCELRSQYALRNATGNDSCTINGFICVEDCCSAKKSRLQFECRRNLQTGDLLRVGDLLTRTAEASERGRRRETC